MKVIPHLNIDKDKYIKDMSERLKSQAIKQNMYIPLISIFIGVFVALLVALFRFILDYIFKHTCGTHHGFIIILFPAIGGLLTGLWLMHNKTDRATSVEGISDFISSKDERRGSKEDTTSVVASILTVGFGGSLGPEAPSAQLGGALALRIGNSLRLESEYVKSLVACGVASGVSAAFNAPITGAIFVIEVIYKKLPKYALGSIMLSSAVSAAFTEVIFGHTPAFSLPTYKFEQGYELVFYSILGLFTALLITKFNFFLDVLKRFFDEMQMPLWLKPLVGGYLVGCIGYFGSPEILGIGYSSIENILKYSTTYFVFVLLFLKILSTSITLGSRGHGGLIAPSLFFGACFGSGFGLLLHSIMPHVNPSSFGLVGMGAFLAGLTRAPMLGIILPFELTQSYQIILPTSICIATTIIFLQAIENQKQTQ